MNKTSILVVSNDERFTGDITEVLGRLGYQVEVTGYSVTEIKAYLRDTLDVILVHLPSTDYIDASVPIQTYCEINYLPVVFCLERIAENLLGLTLSRATYGYVNVPVDENTLRATIELAMYRNVMDLVRKEAERRYRLLVETMNDGLIMVNAAGIILFLNQKTCDMTGYSSDELLNRPFVDFFDEANRAIVEEQLAKRRQGVHDYYDIEWTCKNGRKISTIMSPQPLFDDTGHFRGSFAIITDITERKRAQDLMHIQHELAVSLSGIANLQDALRYVVESAIRVEGMDSGGIYLVDPATGALDLACSIGFSDAFVSLSSHFDYNTPNANIVYRKMPVYVDYSDLDVPDKKVLEGLQAIAILPIVYRNEVIGCLNVASHTVHGVPAAAREALETIASSIASAIVRLRAEETLQRRNEELTAAKNELEAMNEELQAALEEMESVNEALIQSQDELIELNKMLNESTTLLQTVLDTIPARVFWKDRESRYLGCNMIFARDAGLAAPAEIVGKRDHDMVWRDQADKYCADDAAVIESGIAKVNYEEPQSRPDGTEYWVRTTKIPLRNSEGAIIGILGSYEDITERKVAEESLQFFKRMVDEAPFAAAIADFENEFIGRIQYVNREVVRLTGYELDEIGTATNFMDLVYPDPAYRAFVFENWQKAILRAHGDQGSIQPQEYRIRRKDGAYAETMWMYSALGDKSVILVLDITERRMAEEAVRSSEKKYRSLYESMLDGYVRIDADGRIVECNAAYREMLGYDENEIMTLTYSDVTPERWHELQDRIIREQVLTRGFSDLYEKEYRRRDGSVFPVELRTYRILDERDQYAGMWAIVHDLTKRKQAEQELLKASKIESLGILAGGIAHDFNNLLMGIVGNISLVRNDIEAQSRNAAILGEAERASLRARDLANQLLTFSKGGVPVRQLVSVKSIIRESAEFVLSGSNVKCVFAIADDLWNAHIDEAQISQVINNIIINARQAMGDRGRIDVRADNVHVDSLSHVSLDPGDYVRVSVTDKGCGIAAEDLQSIFDPYYTTKKDGNGLGLTITYSIVKNHGGCVTVDSAVGKGSTFTVYLPASKSPVLANEDGAVVSFKGSGRVLVMDDDESVLSVAAEMLRVFGFDPELAHDGEEAIERYREAQRTGRPFSLVIMDLTIPGGMGGKEAIAVLREIDPKVRAVVSSGYSNDPIMSNYRDYGFMGIVAKPYRLEELRRMLQGLAL